MRGLECHNASLKRERKSSSQTRRESVHLVLWRQQIFLLILFWGQSQTAIVYRNSMYNRATQHLRWNIPSWSAEIGKYDLTDREEE